MPNRPTAIRRRAIRSAIGLGRGPAAVAGRVDQAVLRAFRTRWHTPAAERAVRALGSAGEHGMVWGAIGLSGAAIDESRRARWLRGAAVGPAAVWFNYGCKVTIGRKRPLITEHPALARAPSKLSFPSSHSTSSVAAAVALGRVEPRARPALYLLAGLMCAGRPYLGMHYPSDVLAGVALGALLGRIVPGLDAAAPSPEERLRALREETADVREERLEVAEAEADAALERGSLRTAPDEAPTEAPAGGEAPER